MGARAVAVAVGAALALAGCGEGESKEKAERPKTTATTPAEPALNKTVGPDAVANIGDDQITKASYRHWYQAAKKQGETIRKGPRTPRGIRTQTMTFLISSKWLALETGERGISASDAEIRREFEAQKKQSFPNEAGYRRFLRSSGQTEADLLFRIRVNLLTEKLEREVTRGAPRKQKALNKFVAGFLKKYRAITWCAPGYVFYQCANGRVGKRPNGLPGFGGGP